MSLPIIYKGQLRTILFLLIFISLGYLFHFIFSSTSAPWNEGASIWRRDKVEVFIRGAHSSTGKKLVHADWSYWQLISKDNEFIDLVDWNRIPLSKRVYHGLELSVPFRILRKGEKIRETLVYKSNGQVLQSVPCIRFSKLKSDIKYSSKWYDKVKSGQKNNYWRACLIKFINAQE